MYSNVSERGESLFAKSYDSKYKFCNTNISNLSCPNRQEEKRPHYLTIMHQFLKCRAWNKTLSKILTDKLFMSKLSCVAKVSKLYSFIVPHKQRLTQLEEGNSKTSKDQPQHYTQRLETYSEPGQTPKMECLEKKFNGQKLVIFQSFLCWFRCCLCLKQRHKILLFWGKCDLEITSCNE